ncbi:phage antirepressor N-terminal domain-containing protein [Arthrobacter sp. PAMC25564]|uniref:phage antirepressor N-terminal domain-containing protein n=1 Tax=Arthrobacter sp. PAMC25564 TaxID=2565366 RepID=UPI00197C4C79|nr:phage antirepressor N-terminal domain-containing protein [Arthrobacter sp. PAMC25564]
MSDEGKPLVSLRHVCESLGIDTDSQRKKLLNKSWACTVLNTVQVPGDTQTRKWLMIDRRTMTMWLATIEPSRVKPAARLLLEAFQNEAADALDAYFHDGGAINPRATESQLDEMQRKAKFQLELINLARPSIMDAKFLDSKARIVIARALGEEPEIDPLDMPLYAEEYLKDNGVPKRDMAGTRSMFGRRVSNVYKDHYGVAPKKAANEVNGGIRSINSYTERDRWIFDQVWNEFYADKYSVSMFQEAI